MILTSGTTGTPKGAQRSSPDGLLAMAALIDKIPYRSRETMVVAAPLFHSWGFFHFVMSLPTASTMVLRRRFDPEGTLQAVQDHRAQVLAVVPVMLQRILQLPEETLAAYDLSSLRITSALRLGAAGRAGDRVDGPLRRQRLQPLRLDRGRLGDGRHPGGPACRARHRGAAAAGHRRARSTTRRGARCRGARSGGSSSATRCPSRATPAAAARRSIDGLLCSGDVGHLDAGGRLFIDGRDDEMIVSGGENVFPREVEDLLADHEAVVEVAVIGVDDEEFGQRLKAFVVTAEAEVSEEELKAHVKANLASYKAPREIEFLDELPRNATGKVLKRELRERETAEVRLTRPGLR